MVNIAIIPAAGNSGGKYFPHSGYLGISPVTVQGTVIVSPDDSAKPAPATQLAICVRCYEARIGRSGISRSLVLVEHSQILWAANPSLQFENISSLELPFKIVLPPSIGGFSSLSLPEYRIFWRLEAVLTHAPNHRPRDRLFKSHDLRFIRYDTIPPLPPHLSSASRSDPSWDCQISVPSEPFGPTDIIPVHLSWGSRDPALRALSLKLQLERHLFLLGSSSPTIPHSSLQTPTHASFSNGDSWESNSITSPSLSTISFTSTVRSDAPLLSPLSARSKGNAFSKPIVTEVAKSQGAVPNEVSFEKTIPLALPVVKSSGHWQHGFTSNGQLASVRFFLYGQITISSPHGQQFVGLEPIELTLVATNQSERSVAQTKVDQFRSKSKSPSSIRSHRSHRHENTGAYSTESDEVSATTPHPKFGKNKTSRRPHTSSGPTRTSKLCGEGSSLSGPLGYYQGPSRPPVVPLSPSTAGYPPSSFRFVAKGGTRGSSAAETEVRRGLEEDGGGNKRMKDWEEELERVVSQSSQRSAEMVRVGRRGGGGGISGIGMQMQMQMQMHGHVAPEHGRGSMDLRSRASVVAALPAS